MTKTKPKSTRPKLNVKLLRRIQKAILKEPKRINMGQWGIDTKHVYSEYLPPCETIGCIAGWALAVDRKGKNRLRDVNEIKQMATHKLGLSRYEQDPLYFGRLFYPLGGWPFEWTRKLWEHIGTPAYAQVVADYIDYFIEQNEQKETT